MGTAHKSAALAPAVSHAASEIADDGLAPRRAFRPANSSSASKQQKPNASNA